jgi:PilZ domain
MQPDKDAGELAPQDRRFEYRHAVQRPCRVTPATAPQIEMGGFTTNVSRSGMLVRFQAPSLSPALPKVGEFARIFIDLPSNGSFAPRSLECAGRVVRAAGNQCDDSELAFEILSMKIRARRAPHAPRKRERTDLVQ